MSLNPYPEQQAIIARTVSVGTLAEGRVYDEVPEETVLEKDALGLLVKPYIIVSFGQLVPEEGSRSIEGADQQPQIMPIVWECWAATMAEARQMSGQVAEGFVGWRPSADNASEIDLRSGMWRDGRSGGARPSRSMQSVAGETTINNSIVVP